MSVISIRSFFSRQAFWILLGTIMLPLNLVFAIVFWLQAQWGGAGNRARSACCLNVQLTYTLAFLLPVFLAKLFCTNAFREMFPSGALCTVMTGILFSLVCLAGIVLLIFFNTRTFAEEFLGHDFSAPRRIRFVPE